MIQMKLLIVISPKEMNLIEALRSNFESTRNTIEDHDMSTTSSTKHQDKSTQTFYMFIYILTIYLFKFLFSKFEKLYLQINI